MHCLVTCFSRLMLLLFSVPSKVVTQQLIPVMLHYCIIVEGQFAHCVCWSADKSFCFDPRDVLA